VTYERAFKRAKLRTELGTPAVATPTIRGGDDYAVQRVTFAVSWPRGKSGKLVGRENRAGRTLKLTETAVAEIREAYGDGGRVTMAWLADYYNVSVPTICGVIHRYRWRDVP
jgi:hypothetical protein